MPPLHPSPLVGEGCMIPPALIGKGERGLGPSLWAREGAVSCHPRPLCI